MLRKKKQIDTFARLAEVCTMFVRINGFGGCFIQISSSVVARSQKNRAWLVSRMQRLAGFYIIVASSQELVIALLQIELCKCPAEHGWDGSALLTLMPLRQVQFRKAVMSRQVQCWCHALSERRVWVAVMRDQLTTMAVVYTIAKGQKLCQCADVEKKLRSRELWCRGFD